MSNFFIRVVAAIINPTKVKDRIGNKIGNNTEVKPTAAYYVQRLYGQNYGDTYIPASVTLSNTQDAVSKRFAYSVVKDSKTNDLIVKLVNLLPLAVTSQIDFNGLISSETKATKTLMKGEPSDKVVLPVESNVVISNTTEFELPAYSFTVIRIKSK